VLDGFAAGFGRRQSGRLEAMKRRIERALIDLENVAREADRMHRGDG
jgi:hypothetical protein